MSQAKVDNRKKQKTNRKKHKASEQFKYRLTMTIMAICAIAIVCYIGYSAYDSLTANQTVAKTEINIDSITDCLTSLS